MPIIGEPKKGPEFEDLDKFVSPSPISNLQGKHGSKWRGQVWSNTKEWLSATKERLTNLFTTGSWVDINTVLTKLNAKLTQLQESSNDLEENTLSKIKKIF